MERLSVAHDHHNLIVVGADDASMWTAARRAADLGGGMVVARDDEVLAEVPLPYGGLMSGEPIEKIRRELDAAIEAARELGSPLHDPFMAMSFLALEVIPSLKLTDQGLVGRIVVPAGRYAKVLLLSDPSLVVSAMLTRTRQRGLD